MLREEDAVRLRLMLDSAEEALGYVSGRKQDDLLTDRQLVHSLVRCNEIIGEAARNVSEECTGRNADIPWSRIVGMRNRLIHAYFDVDLTILWRTVSEELPVLVAKLALILSDASED